MPVTYEVPPSSSSGCNSKESFAQSVIATLPILLSRLELPIALPIAALGTLVRLPDTRFRLQCAQVVEKLLAHLGSVDASDLAFVLAADDLTKI